MPDAKPALFAAAAKKWPGCPLYQVTLVLVLQNDVEFYNELILPFVPVIGLRLGVEIKGINCTEFSITDSLFFMENGHFLVEIRDLEQDLHDQVGRTEKRGLTLHQALKEDPVWSGSLAQ